MSKHGHKRQSEIHIHNNKYAKFSRAEEVAGKIAAETARLAEKDRRERQAQQQRLSEYGNRPYGVRSLSNPFDSSADRAYGGGETQDEYLARIGRELTARGW